MWPAYIEKIISACIHRCLLQLGKLAVCQAVQAEHDFALQNSSADLLSPKMHSLQRLAAVHI